MSTAHQESIKAFGRLGRGRVVGGDWAEERAPRGGNFWLEDAWSIA